MKNSCTYTLSTFQIFITMFRSWMLRTCAVSTAVLFTGAGIAFWMLHDEAIGLNETILLVLAIAAVTLCADLLVILVSYVKARSAPPLPAGKTTLEWDGLSLAAKTDGKFFTIPWHNLEYRRDKAGGITLYFPDGHYTYVFTPLVRNDLFENLLLTIDRRAGGTSDVIR